jgi:hypothetical protein
MVRVVYVVVAANSARLAATHRGSYCPPNVFCNVATETCGQLKFLPVPRIGKFRKTVWTY